MACLVQNTEGIHKHDNVYFFKAKKLRNPSHTFRAVFGVTSPSKGILDQQIFSVRNSWWEYGVEDRCEAGEEGEKPRHGHPAQMRQEVDTKLGPVFRKLAVRSCND